MHKFTHPLLGLILVLFFCLAACSGDKASEVSDEELLTILNAHLAQNPPAAIFPSGSWNAEIPQALPFDLITPKQSLAKSRAEHPALFALADAGVLIITQDTVLSDNVFGKSEKLPGLHIDLSEEGHKWYEPASGKLRFAEATADRILARKENDTGQLRITVSLKNANVAAWAEKSEIKEAFPAIAEFLADGQEQKTDYLLKYNGTAWQVAKPDELVQ